MSIHICTLCDNEINTDKGSYSYVRCTSVSCFYTKICISCFNILETLDCPKCCNKDSLISPYNRFIKQSDDIYDIIEMFHKTLTDKDSLSKLSLYNNDMIEMSIILTALLKDIKHYEHNEYNNSWMLYNNKLKKKYFDIN